MYPSVANPLDRIQRGGGRVKVESDGDTTVSKSLEITGPRPWIDVRAYGATGDGVTDDTAAIQAAITALPNGGRIRFPAGTYALTDELNFRDKLNIICDCDLNARFIPRTGSNFTGKALVDFAGTRRSVWNGGYFSGTLAVNVPSAAMVISRTANDGAYNRFQDIYTDGNWTVAAVYNAGGEIEYFINCAFQNALGPGYYDTHDDSVRQLGGGGSYSNTRKYFWGCQFGNFALTGQQDVVTLAGNTQEVVFRDCYFAKTSTGITRIIALVDEVAGTGVTHRLTVDNCRVEGNLATNIGNLFIYSSKTSGMTTLNLRTLNWTQTDNTYLIDLLTSASELDIVQDSQPGGVKLFQVRSPAILRLCRIRGQLGGMIQMDVGATATENILQSTNGYPFVGAGLYRVSGQEVNVINGNMATGLIFDYFGTGSPEGVVTAGVGNIYRDIAGSGTYRKNTGIGSTGWIGGEVADIGALVDNTGGVVDNTLQAIIDPTDAPGTADILRDDLVLNTLPAIRNDLADLAEQCNALRTAMRNHGDML